MDHRATVSHIRLKLLLNALIILNKNGACIGSIFYVVFLASKTIENLMFQKV